MTSYEYDDAGRLARSVPEQEWDEQQQAHMIALAEYRDLRCPGCAGHLPDTTNIEADGRYVADPVQCHACAAREIGAKRYADSPQPASILFATRRR